jgi:cAMP-binding proteins - catabolite gene activator and regulatory subunit of cAMP-dependent protein kinases
MFVLQGIVRGYYLDENGNDVTKCFSKEKEWCCLYNYLEDGPAPFYVEALENCILAEIKVSDIHELMVKYPSITMLYQKLINKAFLKIEEKGAAFQRMDAKEI